MTTAVAPLTMPLKPASSPESPRWSGRRFARAIEARRHRTGEKRTAFLTRLAGLVGTSVQTLYAWQDSPARGRPDFDALMALCAELGVTPEDLGE